MHDTFHIDLFVVLLMVTAAVVMAVKWVRLPYSISLVIVGLPDVGEIPGGQAFYLYLDQQTSAVASTHPCLCKTAMQILLVGLTDQLQTSYCLVVLAGKFSVSLE